MILALSPSRARRLTAVAGAVALIAAACSAPMGPAPSFTPQPTLPPTAMPYTLAPAPSGCPTTAPDAMPANTTATVTMHTNYGDIVIKVEANLGPHAAGAFLALARCGYYNNVVFHRVIKGFMIQAGDGQYARLPSPQTDRMGQGGPSWTILDDPVPTTTGDPYPRGTLAIANTGCLNSGSSQFFIVMAADTGLSTTHASTCPAEQPSPSSTATAGPAAGYAIFGHVTTGMDVADKIANLPVGGYDAAGGGIGSIPEVPVVITGTTVSTP